MIDLYLKYKTRGLNWFFRSRKLFLGNDSTGEEIKIYDTDIDIIQINQLFERINGYTIFPVLHPVETQALPYDGNETIVDAHVRLVDDPNIAMGKEVSVFDDQADISVTVDATEAEAEAEVDEVTSDFYDEFEERIQDINQAITIIEMHDEHNNIFVATKKQLIALLEATLQNEMEIKKGILNQAKRSLLDRPSLATLATFMELTKALINQNAELGKQKSAYSEIKDVIYGLITKMQDTFRVLSLPKLLDIYNQGSEGDNKKDAELACMYQLSTIEGQLQLIDMRIKNLKDLGDDATAITLMHTMM